MQGNAKSIFSVFTENSRFIVPIYQRPYSWKIEECKQMWADILACARGDRDKHFFGSTVRVPDASGMIVIDGQQRITTVSLLMLAIRNLLCSGEKTATRGGSTKDWILNEFLLERCYPPRMDAMKLALVHGDAESYAALFENPQGAPETNLKRNYEFFVQSIRAADVPIDALLGGIEKLIVIDIDIEKKDQPQLVFESINSTGRDLTEGDKIRNFILMGLTAEQQVYCYEHYWRRIEDLVKREDENADSVGLFVRDVLTVFRAEIPGLKVIYPEFKRFVLDSADWCHDTEAMLKTLLEYAECYNLLLCPRKIGSKQVAFEMCSINRQECLPSYPFLVEVFRRWRKGEFTESQIVDSLRIVDAFVLRRLICDLPTNSLNKIFTDLNKAIAKMQEDDPGHAIPFEERLACVLKSRTGKARFPGDNEFMSCMLERHIYDLRTKNRAYLFSRLEHGTSRTAPVNGVDDPVFQNISDRIYTVEHVMPQTLTDEWREMLGPGADEVHKVWLHRLGNLTLTAYNSEMGNKEYAAKKSRTLAELKSDNFGFQEEAHHLYLTEYIAQQNRWTEAEISERARVLAQRAVSIWPYPQTTYIPPEPPRFSYGLVGRKNSFFTGSKPIGFRFQGVEYKSDNWTAITQKIFKLLAAVDAEALRRAAAASKTARFSLVKPTALCDEIIDGVYAICSGSVFDKCSILHTAFAYFPGLDVEFIFSTEIDDDEDSEP